MIENTTYIKCRPSQLTNLGHLGVVLLLVPLLFIPAKAIGQILPMAFMPDSFVNYLPGLPACLFVTALLKLGYHVLQTRCTVYKINPEELQHTSGILHRKHGYIELYRIKDFRVDRPLIYRFFGRGNLVIYTSDKTTPVFRLEAIKNPEEVYTILRGLVELNRKEKHVFEVD
ncbi:PH domain-containing protein [Mariniphaga anaerophila]|uniref:PH domain-containing protein n=1 Tax=Mariniphaga anaerophila TaxID=1484053 RepID=A0A1M4SV62_9BACT|nr:PH domain-containing protein [Mariniphaga anaerophila]SHE35867.1 PH domain-containing protein [Mariniphaga anaerophila]